jgi:lysozyme family protein
MGNKYDDPIGEIILKHEGGFVDDVLDRGGATNLGITQETLSNWRGVQVSKQDVKDLTEEEAREIYQRNYLEKPKIDMLPFPHPQVFVFDMAVNHGPGRGIKICQKTINKAGFGTISVDGGMGPATAAAAAKAQEEMGPYFQNAMVEERKAFYEKIMANDPSQERFRNGWTNRANSFILEV